MQIMHITKDDFFPIFNIAFFTLIGISKLAYRLALLKAKNHRLHTANKVLSKRQRAKKNQLRLRGLLNAAKAEAIQVEKGIVNAKGKNIPQGGTRAEVGESSGRRCSNCGKTGHNVQTYQVVWETSKEEVNK
ncbi:transposase [Colletotrichum tofieldiae]|uniref:Transposase n=1 Tax=Colletotrichum tofieldiae TaxID=708197 RepID=A0A161VYV1_9PEZI|nr:transposase [Colletotrichum tofieldiae]